MGYLTIRAQLLRVNGTTRTLRLAEQHNTRRGYSQFDVQGRVQYSHRSKNIDLIGLNGESLQTKVFRLLTERGIDPTSKALSARNRGFGVELVVSVTAGHKCCYDVLYSDALQALIDLMPGCPIAHAVIHYDEATPHMHVVVVPIVNGKLKADVIRGYVNTNHNRTRAVYDSIKGHEFGLTYTERLKGAMKESGAQKVIATLIKMPEDKIWPLLKGEITSAIHARPEPFLAALGISFESLHQDFIEKSSDASHER